MDISYCDQSSYRSNLRVYLLERVLHEVFVPDIALVRFDLNAIVLANLPSDLLRVF